MRTLSHLLPSLNIILLTVASSVIALEKMWLPDLEWRTKENWEGGRLPDIDAHVIFPLGTRHAVGIARSMDLTLSEIDLPREGSLVLSRDGKLQLSDSEKFKGKIAKWAKQGHYFWADPENWLSISKAAPDLERVPCRYDDVILPSATHTLSVSLPITNVQVRLVKVTDRPAALAKWEWEEHREGREFSGGRTNVAYSRYACDSCPCQEVFLHDYLEEICAIQGTRCGSTFCEYPLKVEGHCCLYCGGRVSLAKNVSLPMVRYASDEVLRGYAGKVSWYVRRTWKAGVEVLVRENGEYNGVDSAEATERLKKLLEGEGFEVLGMELGGAALTDARLAVALGTFFTAPLIVCVILLLVFSHFGYNLRQILSGCREMFTSVREGIRTEKSQPAKPFGFARFENVHEGNVEIADAPGTSAEDEDTMNEEDVTLDGGSSGARFENPLYRSKKGPSKAKDKQTSRLDLEAPLSLTTLKDAVDARMEEVEMDIEQ